MSILSSTETGVYGVKYDDKFFKERGYKITNGHYWFNTCCYLLRTPDKAQIYSFSYMKVQHSYKILCLDDILLLESYWKETRPNHIRGKIQKIVKRTKSQYVK